MASKRARACSAWPCLECLPENAVEAFPRPPPPCTVGGGAVKTKQWLEVKCHLLTRAVSGGDTRLLLVEINRRAV